VLQLVEARVLSLDVPLSTYAPSPIADDLRADRITACNVLSHSTGLPNWRSERRALKTCFPPGERFSYSGEGFFWLQQVVEHVTGEPLEALAERFAFAPMGMQHSSYVWQTRFEDDYAEPHGAARHPQRGSGQAGANAAYSLVTMAADYALFLRKILADAARGMPALRQAFLPQLLVPQGQFEYLGPSPPDVNPQVAWGLGWGLETGSKCLFHWSANDGFNAFVIGDPAGAAGVVLLNNVDNGLAMMPEIMAALLPGERPSLAWLGYGRK
jgi:CubicO group peptidase (beta-lactamase class C family)